MKLGGAKSTQRILNWLRPRYRALEAACDACSWVVGLAAVGLVTRDLPEADSAVWLAAGAVVVAALSTGSGLLAGLYLGRFRRGSLDEMAGIARAACATGLALAVLGRSFVPGQRAPLATIAGATLLAALAMVCARHAEVAFRQSLRPRGARGVKVIVFGAGDAGAALVRSLAKPATAYLPVAFLDDDPAKRRLRISGVPVLGDRRNMAEVAARTGAQVLVIAIARASGSAIRDLTFAAEECGLTPKVIPSAAELLSGGARIDGVRDPRITDLLGRRPVQTDVAGVGCYFAGKRILVTGAGGSIGAELCRQLNRFGPAALIMLDRDESALHAVQLELHGRALLDSDLTVLADIRDAARIGRVFADLRPDIVFHAAALKHLPLLQRYPAEAVQSNVLGTLAVLDAAAACGARSFVNISTDKAAEPASVLGYSKRIAERLTADMARRAGARYLSVRFGNVLGSRGSVLTAFSAQVATGAPVTVTHPEVCRYFMTADEAVQLVLQAAAIGRAGEVLVLDMGEQVKIVDIARRLVAQSPDVEIVFTGLRPGEKLSETLLGAGEVDERPFHPLIRHVPVPPLEPRHVADIDASLPRDELTAVLARCSSLPAETAGQDVALSELIRGPRRGMPVAGADRQAARP